MDYGGVKKRVWGETEIEVRRSIWKLYHSYRIIDRSHNSGYVAFSSSILYEDDAPSDKTPDLTITHLYFSFP